MFKQIHDPTKDTVNERLHNFPHYTQRSCGGQVTKFNVMITVSSGVTLCSLDEHGAFIHTESKD